MRTILLVLMVIGCAHVGPADPAGAPRATLEVVNLNPFPAVIDVAGEFLGAVPPGGRHRFRMLNPGVTTLVARASGTGAQEWKSQKLLLSGKVVTWQIAPQESGESLPVPPPLASLRLTNTSNNELEFKVGSNVFRTLMPKDTRVVNDLSVGKHQLVIRVPLRRYERRIGVLLEGGRDNAIDVSVETGSVVVTNNTGEDIALLINGITRAQIPDGATKTVKDLVVGLHQLKVRGRISLREYRRQVRLKNAQSFNWDLSATDGRVTLKNLTGEQVTFELGQNQKGTLAVNAATTLNSVQLGVVKARAHGSRTNYTWNAELSVTPSQHVTWTLRNNVGSIRAKNNLSEPVQIQISGKSYARIMPGKTVFIDEVPSGKLKVEVFCEVSKVSRRHVLQITPRNSAMLTVTEPKARLQVVNGTSESVTVFLNSQPIGTVEPKRNLMFTQLPPGHHLVEALGAISKVTTKGKVRLSSNRSATWAVNTETGKITITNLSGETLLAPPSLQPQFKQVSPGDTACFEVPVGNRVIHFLGQRSSGSYYKRFTVNQGTDDAWEIHRLTGKLHIYNTTPEDQELLINNTVVGTIKSRKEKMLTLDIGPHRLVAVGKVSQHAQNATVVLHSRAVKPWEIGPALSHIRVTNRTSETIDLRVDGLALGFLQPDATAAFGPLKPGKHKFSAQGRWSKAIYNNEMVLAAGRVDTWQLLPAHGGVHVRNARAESVRVLVNGKQMHVVEGHKEHRFTLPLGPHLVELIGQDSHEMFINRLRVRPDRTYTVDAPLGPAVLLVHNQLTENVSIRIDHVVLAIVAPGEKSRVIIKGRGDITVLADVKDKAISWHRKIQVKDDSVTTWVIQE